MARPWTTSWETEAPLKVVVSSGASSLPKRRKRTREYSYLLPMPLVTSFCTRQLMSSATQISSSDGHAMP